MYQLRLWLAGSESLWLQAQAVHGEARVREQAERVRHFLRLERVQPALTIRCRLGTPGDLQSYRTS